MTGYKPREIAKILVESLKNMPVVVLSGMRQTGKSTILLNQLELKNRQYFSFDDFNVLEAARMNPEEIVSSTQPITIDEAQKFPEILSYIKKAVDKKRRPGQFLLSGSSNFLLLKNIAESLAGRAIYLTLRPFTYREVFGITKKMPALIYFLKNNKFSKVEVKPIKWGNIVKGGMPSVCLGEVGNPDIWFRGYEQTYLERDIRSLSQVGDLVSFRNLLKLVALRNAQILKQSELARDAKLNVMTTARYLALMETSCIIHRMLPYLRNRSSRLIKSPKIYLSDSGLAYYLAGIRNLGPNETLSGALWENYVAQNLESILSVHLPGTEIAYWNIQGRYEVDFILEIGKETVAFEVKSSSRWQEKDLVGLKAYLNSSKNCRAAILLYNGKEILKLGDKMWVVPVPVLLS